MTDGTTGKLNFMRSKSYMNSKSARMHLGILGFAASAVCGFIFVAGGTAQTAGPIRPVNPPASTAPATPAGVPVGPSSASTRVPVKQTTSITLPPPTIPIEQIIQKFAAKESAFKEARGNYTYTQTVTVKDFEPTGEQSGEYHMVADIIFTPEGKRFENVTFAPMNTLAHLMLSPEDKQDLENIQPFVLTTEELPKYDIKYVTHEPVDQLTAFVFDVAPKKIEHGQRYFQGRIWVEDKDFAIVKSHGKAVPDQKGNIAPYFDTYRENITADLWFPTYTHADDILHFPPPSKGAPPDDERIVMTVKYENYKYYGVKVKIGTADKKQP
ncbi:MAG TPA: hypothetical protein VIH72_04780 [Candidatus Acidoferrales bacterium]